MDVCREGKEKVELESDDEGSGRDEVEEVWVFKERLNLLKGLRRRK